MKDDIKEYEKLLDDNKDLLFSDNEEDVNKAFTKMKELADKGNINASFRLSVTEMIDIPEEERNAYRNKVLRQYEEEPEEFDSRLLDRIAEYYFWNLNRRDDLDLMKERLKWYRRAYALDKLDAASEILYDYRVYKQYSLDDEYCDFCLEILRDADYYIRNDTELCSDGSREQLGTVGDAVNGLIELANRGNSRAEQKLKKAFESGFFQKDADVEEGRTEKTIKE